MVLAFAPQTRRVEKVLEELWRSSVPDRKKSGVRIAKVGPEQIAKKAQVREAEVRGLLEMRKAKGCLDYGEKVIRFYREPVFEGGEVVDQESPV
jgi:hypothetical protein